MATAAYSLLGRWKWTGGPASGSMFIYWEDDGTAGANFKCAGVSGKVKGIFMEGCKKLKGSFMDPESNENTKVIINLDSTGKSWSCDGTSWKGRRFSWKSSKSAPPVKTNETWERLQKPIDRQERSDRARALWESQNDHDQNTKHAQRHGLMGQVPPNCIGDAYVDAPKVDPRLLGRNLVCSTNKPGKFGKDTTFGPVMPNAIGDPYLGANERARSDRLKAAAALAEKQAFKPAGKRIVGRVDKYLLAVDADTPPDAVQALVNESIAAKQLPKVKEVVVKPRNVYTSHVVGNMLGERTEAGKKLYEYHHSDFDIPKQMHMEELKVWHEKVGDRPSFKCATNKDIRFSTNQDMYANLWPGGVIPFQGRANTRGPEDKAPFFPTTVTKKDRESGCFAKFPHHMPEPEPERVLDIDTSGKPKWKPTEYPHTTLSRSVTRNMTNIRARMTAKGSTMKL